MNRPNKILTFVALLLMVVIVLELAHLFHGTPSAASIPADTLDVDQDTVRIERPVDEAIDEAIEAQAAINNDWVYEVSEDRLNDTRNYSADILSTDAGMQLHIADIDALGNGHYTTAFAIGWYDEAMPECYDRIYVGIKFPGDEKWEKYVVNCNGRAGGFDELMIPDKLVDALRQNTRFSILLGNHQFDFKASTPLRWSH